MHRLCSICSESVRAFIKTYQELLPRLCEGRYATVAVSSKHDGQNRAASAHGHSVLLIQAVIEHVPHRRARRP